MRGVLACKGGDVQWQKMPREIYMPPALDLLGRSSNSRPQTVTTHHILFNSLQLAGLHPSERQLGWPLRMTLSMIHNSALQVEDVSARHSPRRRCTAGRHSACWESGYG